MTSSILKEAFRNGKNAEGGAISESQDHGSGTDFLFSGFSNLHRCSATSRGLVGADTVGSSRYGCYYQLSCVAEQTPMVAQNSALYLTLTSGSAFLSPSKNMVKGVGFHG